VEKELKEFHKDKKGKYGVRSQCNSCRAERHKECYPKNKEQIKEYYERNKETILRQQKEYRTSNKVSERRKKHQRKYERERRQNDPVYRMISNYRCRTSHTYKNKVKSTIELLGCTGIELANHLEKQFQEGMTHDNYGEWHIDHIKPIASFDLSNPQEAEKCFHYTNLQPLWAEDNLSKADKLT